MEGIYSWGRDGLRKYKPGDKSVRRAMDHIRLLVRDKDDEEGDGRGEKDSKGTDKD